MKKILNEDFAGIVATDEIFFVYVTSYSTSLEEIVRAAPVLRLTF